MGKKKRVKKNFLHGHKKVGKRFVPPMKQLDAYSPVSYVNDMLPELIWIGLLNDRLGYIKAARVIERVFTIVEDIKDTQQQGNFALISAYNILYEEQKNSLRNHLAEDEILGVIQNHIAPLILLFEDCPLSFLGPPSDLLTNEELVTSIKECVGRTIDKFDTPGIVLNGAVLLSQLVTRKIKFPSDMELPNLNAVIDSPDSEEAKIAASFIRANALALFGMLKVDSSWARYFWNRGFELSSCEFSNDETSDG